MASKPRKGDSQAVWLWAWDESEDDWRYVRVELNALDVIDHAHVKIHDGFQFIAGHRWTEGDQVADNATAELLIQAGEGMHTLVSVVVGGESEIDFMRGVTFSAEGTAVTKFNKNDYSSNTSSSTITHTPTGASGTAIAPSFISGGSKNKAIGGADGGFATEYIMKSGNNYLVRVTNRSGSAISVAIMIEWYT